VNKAISDVALRRLELAAAERLLALETNTKYELYQSPDTLSTINAVMRNYRSKKAGLKA
jgi:hypothetical protein